MLIFTESFEIRSGVSPSGNVDTDKWNQSSLASFGFDNSSHRTGSWSMFSGTATRQIRSSEEHATLIVGAAWRAPSSATGRDLITFKSDSNVTVHVTISVDTAGAISAYRGSSGGGTLLGASAAGALKFNGSYQYIEAKVTLNDTTGAVVVRVDEIVVLTISGADTKNAGTKTVLDTFAVASFSSNNLDDVYVCNGAGSVNNDFLGAVKIECLLPTGNGNSSQGVGSDGNSTDNYLLMNDNSNTTYVDLQNTGDKDTYVTGDSAQPTGNSVKGVIPWAYAQKTDAGARGINFVARLSATESTSAADALVASANHTIGGGAFETKPGGGAWTVADVNSAEWGWAAT